MIDNADIMESFESIAYFMELPTTETETPFFQSNNLQ